MPIVVVGHVDHGKSTIVGRVLADSGSLPDGKLEQVRELCARTSKPFEYAFLLDALKDERDQGITIDSARVFFKSRLRPYVIIDAPGHVEFLKNMVTGAARADAALLVVDAREGVQGELATARHDAVDAGRAARGRAGQQDGPRGLVRARVRRPSSTRCPTFLARVNVTASAFLPVSGREGVNLVTRGAETPWYSGPTVLEVLDGFPSPVAPAAEPFRMPVQDIYRFTKFGDDRRIVAGTIDSGALRRRRRRRVLSVRQAVPRSRDRRLQSAATGSRGGRRRRRASRSRSRSTRRAANSPRAAGEPPPLVSTRLRVNLFWLGRSPLVEQQGLPDSDRHRASAHAPGARGAGARRLDARDQHASPGGAQRSGRVRAEARRARWRSTSTPTCRRPAGSS